jgi:hypothetical protein
MATTPILRSSRQQNVDALLGHNQDVPLSESECSALRALGSAPVPPPNKTVLIKDHHQLMGFRASRQYAQIKFYVNPTNIRSFEDIRNHNRIAQTIFKKTQDAMTELFPIFAAVHFLTSKDIAKPLAGLPTSPSKRKLAELLRDEVCRENHEDKHHRKMENRPSATLVLH